MCNLPENTASYNSIVSCPSNFLNDKRIENARPVSLQRFNSWDEATKAGYRTRNQWRKLGKGVRDRSLAYIEWKGNRLSLYCQNQTTNPKPKTLAADSLIDRFVVRTDIFGYQPHGSHNDWRQMSKYRWDVRSLMRQGFHHRRCHDQGIRIGKVLAQAFSVRCGEKTAFFVIDVDCHNPTADQIAAHLQLVEIVQRKLPALIQELGGGSTFYQYRQLDTSGIQFWVMLNRMFNTDWLHATVRKFLVGLDSELDQHLRAIGLPGLDQIEIKPSQTQQISMPGCYAKTVFTERELKLVDGWFDVIALNDHIQAHGQAGDVLPRYKALLEANHDYRLPPPPCSGVRAGFATAAPAQRVQPAHPTPSQLEGILSLESMRQDGRRYWTDLKKVAVEGVTTPDRLYEDYLQPLGQCLYFRDFAHEPNRQQLVEDELVVWVMAKNNGLVSREIGEIRRVCRAMVKTLDKKTCQAVKDYYRSILTNDLLYPHRVERLYDYMRAGAAPDKSHTIFCIYCKCGVSGIDDTEKERQKPILDDPLPPTILTKLLEIATAKQPDKNGRLIATMRKRKGEYPFVTFSRRFLNEIWAQGGEANIHFLHLNKMLDLKPGDEDRKTALKCKNLLRQHGLINGNWQKFIRRGTFSSRYKLDRLGPAGVWEVPRQRSRGRGRIGPWIILQR